jgi:hypothetical protein
MVGAGSAIQGSFGVRGEKDRRTRFLIRQINYLGIRRRNFTPVRVYAREKSPEKGGKMA